MYVGVPYFVIDLYVGYIELLNMILEYNQDNLRNKEGLTLNKSMLLQPVPSP